MVYSQSVALAGALLSLLMATLSTNIGVLVSLRASTVRQAAQVLGIGLFVVVWTPMIALNLLPDEWLTGIREAAGAALESGDISQLVLAIAAALLVVDVSSLIAAMARFQRGRLILD